jgi:hypothetical protein
MEWAGECGCVCGAYETGLCGAKGMTAQLPVLIQTDINFELIGHVAPPSTYVGGAYDGLQAGIVNGRAFFYSNCDIEGNGPQGFWGCLIDKDSGDSCQFYDQTMWNKGRITAFRGSNLLQAGDLFLIGQSSGQNQYRLPNVFNNGSVFFIPNQAQSIIGPCGSGNPIATFYSPNQGLIAYEFAIPFGEASQIYASIYSLTPNGQSLINAGYIGSFENGTDGFNQTNLVIPVGVSGGHNVITDGFSAWLRGSATWWANMSWTSPYHFGASQIQIVQNDIPLACGVVNTGTFIQSINAFDFTQAQIPGMWNVSQSAYGSGYCEDPNMYMAVYTNFFPGPPDGRGFLLFSKYFVAQVITSTNGAELQLIAIVLFNDGTIIGIGRAGQLNNSAPIYRAQINREAYGFTMPPIIYEFGQGTANINYTRPISLRGAYKA